MYDLNENRVSAINSSHELALGVAFGSMIGLMPKDSAIPWIIGLVFLLSRGNLLCGIVAALLASVISPLIDPFTHRMGLSVLSVEFLQSTYANWMELPWVAWTRFNNTVVAGSLAVGVIAWLPIYLVGQVFFSVWGIPFIERLMQLPVIRLLFGSSANSDDAAVGDSSLINSCGL